MKRSDKEKRVFSAGHLPPAPFDEMVRLIRTGQTDMARELFEDRERQLARHIRADQKMLGKRVAQSGGEQGGLEKARLNKTATGLTQTQVRRKSRFDALRAEGKSNSAAVKTIAAVERARDDGVTEQAIRESLRAAGVVFSRRKVTKV